MWLTEEEIWLDLIVGYVQHIPFWSYCTAYFKSQLCAGDKGEGEGGEGEGVHGKGGLGRPLAVAVLQLVQTQVLHRSNHQLLVSTLYGLEWI